MYKPALASGIIFAALAVTLGALAAHKLKTLLDATDLATFQTGVTYQFYHSFALLITGILHRSYAFKPLRIATLLFIAGTVLFSGSLYLMVGLHLVGKSIGPLGIVTPIGGICFIVAWFLVLVGILRK